MSHYGKRDPRSHRTIDQIRQMDHVYNHRPEMIRRRGEQNKGRKLLGLKVGDKRDGGHLKMLDHGGKTTKANMAIQSRKKNRGWERDT